MSDPQLCPSNQFLPNTIRIGIEDSRGIRGQDAKLGLAQPEGTSTILPNTSPAAIFW